MTQFFSDWQSNLYKKANTVRYWLFAFIVTPIKTRIGKLFSVNF
ncbi:hypothetical protein MOSL_1756 [Moraxella osloensis]|nr:hypothetical protein MOSL_1756 [Moraxella osloensis]